MTDIKNGDMPASPTQYQDGCNSELYSDNTGMTKREAFAMAAMQGILASEYYGEFTTEGNLNDDDGKKSDGAAIMAVNHADALLKELAK